MGIILLILATFPGQSAAAGVQDPYVPEASPFVHAGPGTFTPKPGDVLILCDRAERDAAVEVATSAEVYRRWAKSRRAGDQDGLDDLLGGGETLLIDPETPVRVIEPLDPVAGQLRGYEVRISAGPRKFRPVWVAEPYLAREPK
jgi:hypothetical protein